MRNCEDLMKPNPAEIIFEKHRLRMGSAYQGPSSAEEYRLSVPAVEFVTAPDQGMELTDGSEANRVPLPAEHPATPPANTGAGGLSEAKPPASDAINTSKGQDE